jgi:elongation factor 1-gamma
MKVLAFLNSHLLTRTYLVGERVTLADISVATTLLYLYQYILEPDLRMPYQNVNRWFQTIIHQPQSIAVLGDFKLAEKTLKYECKEVCQEQVMKKVIKYFSFAIFKKFNSVVIYIFLYINLYTIIHIL